MLLPDAPKYFASLEELLFRRSLRCAVCHVLISSTAVLSWNLLLWLRHGLRASLWALVSPSTWAFFFLFLLANLLFLSARWFVVDASSKAEASLGDIAGAILRSFWQKVLGGKLSSAGAKQQAAALERARTSRGHTTFVLICSIAGALSFFAISSLRPPPGPAPAGASLLSGALLGLLYAAQQLQSNSWVLSYPIIQRAFFFRVKLGFPQAAHAALRLSLLFALLLRGISAAASFFPSTRLAHAGGARCPGLLQAFHATTLLVFCWEMGSYLLEVVLTERCVFAPPLGSTAADTSPSDMLLAALAFTGRKAPVIRHLALMDLCHVAEETASSWRRAALFEETGGAATYSRVVGLCTGHLDALTVGIQEAMRGPSAQQQPLAGDLTRVQMLGPGGPPSMKESLTPGAVQPVFRHYQACAWSARAAAALTGASRTEDQYGTAQLAGCNASVVSSLLSALLAVEAFQGRPAARAPQGASRGGPRFGGSSSSASAGSARNWPSPLRDLRALVSSFVVLVLPASWASLAGAAAGPALRQSARHVPARAMEDVLRGGLYRIVAAFGEEMRAAEFRRRLGGGMVGGAAELAEEKGGDEWLPAGQPLFGTRHAHAEKLALLLDYRDERSL